MSTVSTETKVLKWPDYVVLTLALGVTAAIGFYYGVMGRKNQTKLNYILANRRLNWLPVGISIVVTFVSVVLFTGVPAETYQFGIAYVWYALGRAIADLVSAYLIVPLLFPLKLTSTNEYLERRFKSQVVRTIGSLVGLLSSLLQIGVVTYACASATTAVSGIPLWVSITGLTVLATVYTSLGGLEAVVWTDVFQFIIMMAGIIGMLIQGILEVGGISEVWRISRNGGRLNIPTFDPDPRIPYSMWSMTIGISVTWMAHNINQQTVQRFSSVPDLTSARKAVLSGIPGFTITSTTACFTGIVIYSYYYKIGCDPVAHGDIANINQIVPLFVTEVLFFLPGFPGLYIAALCCASLSTVSSALNSMATLIWEDLLRYRFKKLAERKVLLILKLCVVVIGIVTILLAFLIAQIKGTVIQMAITISGVTGGPLLGLFFLGTVIPKANWIGACSGTTAALVVCFTLAFGALRVPPSSDLPPVPVTGCPSSLQYSNISDSVNFTSDLVNLSVSNSTWTNVQYLTTISGSFEESVWMSVFRISYAYYAIISIFLVLLVGTTVSWITGFSESAEPELLFPFARRTFTRRGK